MIENNKDDFYEILNSFMGTRSDKIQVKKFEVFRNSKKVPRKFSNNETNGRVSLGQTGTHFYSSN